MTPDFRLGSPGISPTRSLLKVRLGLLVEAVLSSGLLVSSGAQAWPIQILRRITRITESLFDIISKVRR